MHRDCYDNWDQKGSIEAALEKQDKAEGVDGTGKNGH